MGLLGARRIGWLYWRRDRCGDAAQAPMDMHSCLAVLHSLTGLALMLLRDTAHGVATGIHLGS